MESESVLTRKVVHMIHKDFPDVWYWKIADRWRSGIPDLLLIRDGRYLWIELKIESGKLSKIQEYTIKKLKEAGCDVAVCKSVLEVKNLIKEVLKCQ